MAIIGIVVIIIIAGVSVFAYMTYFSQGTLKIEMTDPPEWGPATQVYINYSSIEIHRADAANESGWSTIPGTGGTINLTQFVDINQTIGSANLQPGTYNLIRFTILQANVTVNGTLYSATVPSGELQITITEGGIKVNATQTSAVLIELNARVEGSVDSGFSMLVPDIRAEPIES